MTFLKSKSFILTRHCDVISVHQCSDSVSCTVNATAEVQFCYDHGDGHPFPYRHALL